jgi:energy-coupling factor transporter ATP-binding protein EcfA2
MITRIELTNFMSHAHTVIEPAAGLTVLVGPNNCGKSAVVAALQILCHNENSTYVLRHGERECSVKVETDDGHTVEWRRKNSPSYLIDGKLFDRLGRGSVPEELHQVLRLPRVDASDDTDFDVHFGAQKSPIFLLGNSPANAARFFASSSDAIRLVQIQKRHKDKLADRQRQKNHLEAESKQLNAELETLQPVAELERQLKISEQLHQELIQLVARLADAEKTQVLLTTQQVEVTRHTERTHSLAPLARPPELSPTEPFAKQIDSLCQAQDSQAQAASHSAALSALSKPPALFDVAALAGVADGLAAYERSVATGQERLRILSLLTPLPALGDAEGLEHSVDALAAAQKGLAELHTRREVLGSISSPPRLEDESGVSASIASLSEAATQVARWNRAVDAVGGLSAPPLAHETGPLIKLLDELNAALARATLCELALAAANSELSEAIAAVRTFAATEVCPTCGGQFDADRLLASAITGSEGHDHE